MDGIKEQILRRRMHGLYLSRSCEDITELSRELLGMNCWFHRNVAFSALIRGANLLGWNTALTKTWLYRGSLHGVAYDELPTLLALNAGDWRWGEEYYEIAEKVIGLMEDGVYSRAEMRRIFADEYDKHIIDNALSPWGGVFTELARLGKVAFRDMTSRDFVLIDAEPTKTPKEVFPELLRRYFKTYGPATKEDAAWFFGLQKNNELKISQSDLSEFSQIEYNKKIYYYVETGADMGDIPELTLLSGFDPAVVAYAERSAILPVEYKKAVITKSGICLPMIAVNGRVAGIWNIKNKAPVIEFFGAA